MPFPKGVSGSPGGRSREQRRRERLLSDAIRKLCGDDGGVYVERLHEIALRGEHKDSLRALVVLIERAFGKSTDFLEVEGGLADPRISALLDALRMTPHDRRAAAQDSTIPDDVSEDDAALDGLVGGDS